MYLSSSLYICYYMAKPVLPNPPILPPFDDVKHILGSKSFHLSVIHYVPLNDRSYHTWKWIVLLTSSNIISSIPWLFYKFFFYRLFLFRLQTRLMHWPWFAMSLSLLVISNPLSLFLFSWHLFVKGNGLLFHRISYSLGLADCIPWCYTVLYSSCALVFISKSLIRFRFNSLGKFSQWCSALNACWSLSMWRSSGLPVDPSIINCHFTIIV